MLCVYADEDGKGGSHQQRGDQHDGGSEQQLFGGARRPVCSPRPEKLIELAEEIDRADAQQTDGAFEPAEQAGVVAYFSPALHRGQQAAAQADAQQEGGQHDGEGVVGGLELEDQQPRPEHFVAEGGETGEGRGEEDRQGAAGPGGGWGLGGRNLTGG